MNSVIDLLILIVLAISLIWGFLVGFSKKRLSSFASQCGIVVAYFGGSPLISLLAKTNLSVYIQDGFVTLLPKTEAFMAPIDISSLSGRNNQMSQALSEIHIFKLFQGIFINSATDFTNTVGDAIASSFAKIILIVAVYILLFLLVFVLIKIIFSPLWKDDSLFGEKGRSFFGRVCGMVRMLFRTSVLILSVMFVVSLVSALMAKGGNTSLQDWIAGDLNLVNPSGFSIGRLFYNLSSSFFDWINLN